MCRYHLSVQPEKLQNEPILVFCLKHHMHGFVVDDGYGYFLLVL